MNYSDLNQEEAKIYLKEEQMTALLPIGAIEVHGNHLPLDTDCCLAQAVAKKVEERLGGRNCVLLPCVPYGQVWSLGDVPGSIHIPDEVLGEYLYQIAKSLETAGIKKLAVINGHVGNGNAVKAMMRKAYENIDMKIYQFTYPGAADMIGKVCTSKRPHKIYFHADEIETSYMLYLCPEKVRMEQAVSQKITFPADYEYTPVRWSDFMETAVLGDAAAADAEKGKRIIDAVVENIVGILKGEK